MSKLSSMYKDVGYITIRDSYGKEFKTDNLSLYESLSEYFDVGEYDYDEETQQVMLFDEYLHKPIEITKSNQVIYDRVKLLHDMFVAVSKRIGEMEKMFLEKKIVNYLTQHDKSSTKVMYNVFEVKSIGMTLNKFRKYLHTMENRGILVYVEETNKSLPYWRLNKWPLKQSSF